MIIHSAMFGSFSLSAVLKTHQVLNTFAFSLSEISLTFGDSNGNLTRNHLFRKRTHKHLAKLVKPVHRAIITYSQMHRTDTYSQHSSIIKKSLFD